MRRIASSTAATPLDSTKVIDSTVPAQYRDPEGHWAAVALRARVLYASKDRVKQTAISYEELADPKWKGKICTRSGQHMYNNGLFAAVIAKLGEAKNATPHSPSSHGSRRT